MWGILRIFSIQLKESWFPSSLTCSCFEDHMQHFGFNVFSRCPSMLHTEEKKITCSDFSSAHYLIAIPLLSILLQTIFSKSLSELSIKQPLSVMWKMCEKSVTLNGRCLHTWTIPEVHVETKFWSMQTAVLPQSQLLISCSKYEYEVEDLVLQFSLTIIHSIIVKLEQRITRGLLFLLRLSMTIVETNVPFLCDLLKDRIHTYI